MRQSLSDLSTVELFKHCSEQDATADVYTLTVKELLLTVNGFGK